MSPSVNVFSNPAMNQSHVKIKDPANLSDKINKLIGGGTSNLQIVADFDFTLTKQIMQNGDRPPSSFGMFGSCPSVPQTYKDADRDLADYYKPIEVDPFLTVEEKVPHMITWYKKAQDLLKGFKYPEAELSSVAKETAKALRDGTDEIITFAEKRNIPFLVFSAGLGNSVLLTLEQANLMRPNVRVISNFLKIEDDGEINGMKNDIIHVFNKNEGAIRNSEYYELVKDRCNVLVMGDSIGDAGMADGMSHCELTIKIGFLYNNVEACLPAYMDTFDIVLIDDQTMNVPNYILNLLN